MGGSLVQGKQPCQAASRIGPGRCGLRFGFLPPLDRHPFGRYPTVSTDPHIQAGALGCWPVEVEMTLAALPRPRIHNLRVAVLGDDALELSGTIVNRACSEQLSGYLGEVHAWVTTAGIGRLCVDVSGITFVNSSAVRLFVDWATWIRRSPPGSRYELCFVTDDRLTWQRTAFRALESLGGGVVTVQRLV